MPVYASNEFNPQLIVSQIVTMQCLQYAGECGV